MHECSTHALNPKHSFDSVLYSVSQLSPLKCLPFPFFFLSTLSQSEQLRNSTMECNIQLQMRQKEEWIVEFQLFLSIAQSVNKEYDRAYISTL